MAPRPRHQPRTWTPSQVVAHNLTRARDHRRLTQTEVAERLTRFTGSRWTQATVAQAEGSVAGQRVRQFTATELVALARTFDLPVLYFFIPPPHGPHGLETPDAPPAGWPWEYLLMLVWGHSKNFGAVADHAAPWAHASTTLTVPADDVLDGTPEPGLLAQLQRHRERYTPEDVLAVAFHGLAQRRIRGAVQPGNDVTSLARSLRGLADALDAFNNYRPGTFLDDDAIRAMRMPSEPPPS